ncbi:ABC transporter permease [Blastopirellula marina]|uniref:Transport permease protein n=1 Tax=Blastopirellula marina DSM 3645 TaxID=314230 RepID=A3ZTG7_9BACT|nr:ABC transporter permease [Blastopirellula marina]EAQ80228.1 probable membrane protein [Blastopirellula marina DSM 3645]
MASETVAPIEPKPLLAAWSLCQREIVRFLRQRNRIIGAIGQPLLFWLLFGAGMSRTFQLPGAATSAGVSFLEYYFSGTLMLIVLFTAIFATISIIEDRNEGFLQSVLAAPIPRWSMVLGKVMGGALLATLQGVLFLLLALTLKVNLGPLNFLVMAVFLLIVGIGLTSLGFLLAWRMESTQGFHAVMNLLLMPLWLLSGAFFPVPWINAQSPWSQVVMHWVMRLNPVTYAIASLREIMYWGMGDDAPLPGRGLPVEAYWSPSPVTGVVVTIAFAALMLGWACWAAAEPRSGDA